MPLRKTIGYFLTVLFTTTALAGFCSQAEGSHTGAATGRSTVAENGVVAAAHPLAAQAGLDVLKKGGNAFDAAVATAFALGVVEPNASGIGGGGFALLYVAKENKSYVIDFREIAPLKAKQDIYPLDDRGKPVGDVNRTGWKAVGVPGQVAGMELLHKRFGTAQWRELLQPAVDYAENGIEVSETLSQSVMDELDRIQKFPSQTFFQKLVIKDGLPLMAGDKLVNKELAATLRLIAQKGAPAFYKGAIAAAIEKEFKARGDGWITKADLAAYKAVIREPVQANYRGYTLVSTPPPSSGGLTVLEILNILEGFDIRKMGPATPDFMHAMIESQKLAYADRAKYMGDPAFVSVPVTGLLSKEYANTLRSRIAERGAGRVLPGNPQKYESGSTTSFSVVDKEGNMITVTQTINLFWGSGVVPEGTGILMNNEMFDFNATPGAANSPGAGKRPLSSMAPTMILKDGKPFATLGSPGGTRIISALANILVNLIDFEMGIQQAIEAPRFHNANSLTTAVEGGIQPEVLESLKSRGHKLSIRNNLDLYFGGAQGVMLGADGKLYGGADPRRDGVAVGY